MSFCETLVARIDSSTPVTDLIGDRLYPGVFDEKPVTPALRFSVISTDKTSSMGVDDGISRILIQFDIIDKSYKTVAQVSEELQKVLVRWVQTGVQDSYFRSESDEYDKDLRLHRKRLDIEFIVEE